MPEGAFYIGGEAEIRKVAAIAGRNLERLPLLPKIILVGR